jgi:hypothetical protein
VHPLPRGTRTAPPPTGRDIDTAFARLAQKPIDALLVGPGPLLDKGQGPVVARTRRPGMSALTTALGGNSGPDMLRSSSSPRDPEQS